MKFGLALKAMKEGKKVKLPEWKGYWIWDNKKNLYLCIVKMGKY